MIEMMEVEFGQKAGGMEYTCRPAVYGIIQNESGHVGVIRTRCRLFLPGGGLEGTETPHEGLTRECSEEMGYRIEIGEYIGTASQYLISYRNNEPLRIVGHFYQARLADVNHLKSEEDHELVWLPPEEAIRQLSIEFQVWAVKPCMGMLGNSR